MKKVKFCILMLMVVLLGFLFVKLNINAKVINSELIYLDPGHGGEDSGGTSKNGTCEKNINLSICYYLKEFLENSGYSVKMTRYTDCDLASINSKNRKNEDILKRVDLINKSNAILYLSIHCNKYQNEQIKGSQTFYNSSNDCNKELATSIQSFLTIILKNTDRSAHSIKDKYLIDNVTKVGCLTEVGFLSNPKEEQLLTQEKYQKEVAYAIYLGIINYLSNK